MNHVDALGLLLRTVLTARSVVARSGNLERMSSPEASKKGAVGHSVSPWNR
jgi:hypothetical protein